MSTDFRILNPDDSEGEWVATRWGRGGGRGAAFEFGANPSRVMDLREQVGPNTVVRGDDGWRGSGEEFWSLADQHEWSHGEFGGTVGIGDGSGKLSALTNLNPDEFRDVLGD